MKKKCTRCGKRKPLSDFHKDERYKSGIFCWCKSCENEYQNERYHRNPEEVREVHYDWRRRNPDRVRDIKKRAYKKRKRETGLTGYQSKKTKAKRMAIYRENHREELRRKSRERYHKMAKTEDGRRYWLALVHRRLDKGSYVSATMIKSIEQSNIKRYGILTCEYCKVPVGETYHLEHKTPISRGGKSVRINLCIACPECNLNKGVLTAVEYRKRFKVINA